MNIDYKFVLWCIYIGVVLASVYTYYQRNLVGRLVLALLEKECHSPESAATLADLGLERSVFIRKALRPSSVLSRFILAHHPNTNPDGKKSAFDFTTTRFYIPPEKKEKAVRYNRAGSTWLSVLLAVVGGLVFVLLGYLLIPYFSSLLNDLFA